MEDVEKVKEEKSKFVVGQAIEWRRGKDQ